MKKIGILTLPIKTNYGGILQAFAMQYFLRKLGYDAWFIKRRWNCEAQSILHRVIKFIYHHLIIRKFNKFIGKYIVPQTKVIDSRKKVMDLMNCGYDGFVVGSDQVWRIRNVRGADYNYFLDFTKGYDVKRVAYAASFGVDYWDDDQEKETSISKIRPLINQFDAVSTREDTGVTLCKELFGIDAKHMVDPTLLLDKTDYIKTFGLHVQHRNYIAVYILDMTEEKQKIVRHVADVLHLPTKYINQSECGLLNRLPGILNEYGKPDVESWLTCIAEAAFVITDSFHGAAFSINFEKQFIAIGNMERGLTRFTSLLDTFGIKERLVFTYDDVRQSDIITTLIKYAEIASIRKMKKDVAETFVLEYLK